MYYKVVYYDNGKLFSANLNKRFTRNEFIRSISVEYKVGAFVYPIKKYTRLMCFNNLASAHDFRIEHILRLTDKDLNVLIENLKIYSCEVINPQPNGFFVPLGYSNDNVQSYYSKFVKNSRKLDTSWIPPKNTVFCSAIKLIREIKYISQDDL